MTIRRLFFFLFLLGLGACAENNVTPNVPDVLVNEQINLTNIQYNQLRQNNGFVYIAGGVRGIVIIRTSATQYIALERNCSYDPQNTCATVEMDPSRFFLVDPCCNSQFDLFGQVIRGPATYRLRQYATATSGNFLYITN